MRTNDTDRDETDFSNTLSRKETALQKRTLKNERIDTMLNKAKELKGYKLNALDGDIGHVKEFYFDDRHWTIRYLVAETGTWLADRQVLISPYALSSVD